MKIHQIKKNQGYYNLSYGSIFGPFIALAGIAIVILIALGFIGSCHQFKTDNKVLTSMQVLKVNETEKGFSLSISYPIEHQSRAKEISLREARKIAAEKGFYKETLRFSKIRTSNSDGKVIINFNISGPKVADYE